MYFLATLCIAYVAKTIGGIFPEMLRHVNIKPIMGDYGE
jgi:hypothetical protein